MVHVPFSRLVLERLISMALGHRTACCQTVLTDVSQRSCVSLQTSQGMPYLTEALKVEELEDAISLVRRLPPHSMKQLMIQAEAELAEKVR